MRIAVRTLLVLFVCAAAAPAMAAPQQEATAAIRGRVVDQTGAPIAGAAVTLVNTATGARRDATTDASGLYTVPAVPLTGEYTITFAQSGFVERSVQGLALRAGETATVNATLQASGGTTTVQVYGTLEGIRGDSPQLGTRLGAQKIEHTPIIGRKMTNLVLLDSAVRPARGTGDMFLNNTLFVANGNGRRSTGAAIDGGTANDAWGRQTIFTNVPLSAIQEFTFLSSAFSAEYGWSGGSVVNVVTKSGTNRLDGDILALWRPGALEGSLDVNDDKAEDRLWQLSGAAGGPLVQDRTHLFVAAEGNWQDRDSTITSPLAPGIYTGEYRQALLNARVDTQINERHALAVRTNVDAFRDTNPSDAVGGLNLPSAARVFHRRTYTTQVTETAILGSSMFNDARVLLMFGSPITEFDPVQMSTQYVRPGVGTEGDSRAASLHNYQFQIADTLSFTRGRHFFKVGGDAVRSSSGGNGKEFGSGFVLGQFRLDPGTTKPIDQLTPADVQRYTQSFGSSSYETDEWLLSLFVQDDLQVSHDLTLNLGFRYSRQTFSDDTNNLAPRAGFAWRPDGSATTAVRGGYGRYYTELKANHAADFNIGGPTGQFTFSAAPGQFGFPSDLQPLPDFPPGAVLPARDIDIRPGMAEYYSQFFDVSKLKHYPDALLNPETDLVTIGIERELVPGWFGSADFVTQHTRKIDRPLDLNSPASFVRTAPGQTRSAAAADATRPITPEPNGYGRISSVVNDGKSDYNGLQMKLERRAAAGYGMLFSYTLSKTTNTVEPDVPGQDPNDSNDTGEVERALSLLDQRHRAVISGWWTAPAEFLVGGVATLASGRPYNIITGADNDGDGSRNADRPVVDGKVLERNAGKGSAIYDFSLFAERPFDIGGGRQVSLRIEVFNLFNHANIVGRNGTYGNAASGVPLASLGDPLGGINNVDPGRQVQLSGRLRF